MKIADQSKDSWISKMSHIHSLSLLPHPTIEKNCTFILHMFRSKSKLQIFKFLHNCHHLHAVFQCNVTRFVDLFFGISFMVSLEDSCYLKSYISVSGFKNAAFLGELLPSWFGFYNFSGSFYYEMSGILWKFLLPKGQLGLISKVQAQKLSNSSRSQSH